MADIRRKDLKHDKFVEEVTHQLEYFTEHRNTVIVAAVAAVGLIVGGFWYFNHRREVAMDSMGALQQAVQKFQRPVSIDTQQGAQTYVTTGERARDVTAALDVVKTDYPGTKAAAAADYYSALLDIEQENMEPAKTKLQSAIANADPQYASLARLVLAKVLASEGDNDGARQQYEELIAHPTSAVSAPRAKLELARLLVKTDPSAARPLLQELADSEGEAASVAAKELSNLPQS